MLVSNIAALKLPTPSLYIDGVFDQTVFIVDNVFGCDFLNDSRSVTRT